MILEGITVGIFLIIIVYFMLRYLDGDFDIESSEIIKQGSLTNIIGRRTGDYYIIKTVYKSGRIKLKEKRF